MLKLRFMLVGSVVAGLAAVVLSGPAVASPPLLASGTFYQDTFTNNTIVKVVGGNVFLDDHDLHSYTGTFTGTDVFDGTVVVRKDGRVSWHGVSTFTGTVAGCGTGTVIFTTEGGADSLFGPGRCHQEVIGGTLGLHATIDLVGALPNLTYSGGYSC
jgi:hypothetical protein